MLPIPENELIKMGTLTIAQVGDAVYELMTRVRLCADSGKTGVLHKRRVAVVNASSQAAAARRIFPRLTESEKQIFTRGRNTHAGNVPKAASRADYRHATALETLFGWLYLSGQTERAEELFEFCMEE